MKVLKIITAGLLLGLGVWRAGATPAETVPPSQEVIEPAEKQGEANTATNSIAATNQAAATNQVAATNQAAATNQVAAANQVAATNQAETNNLEQVGDVSGAPLNIDAGGKTVVIIPIDQPIMKPQLFLVRKGVQQAIDMKADAIVFRMDTPGGSVDVMEEIVNNFIDIDIPTYTYIEDMAISAGAIIALASDKIYMKEGSRIGDALAMLMNPTGTGYQEMDARTVEKVTAPLDAFTRSVAERKGRDIDLARAMVRLELEYKIGDKVLANNREVLVLTNSEAEQKVGKDQKNLLSEGTVGSIEEMLELEGLGDASLTELEITWSEELAKKIYAIAPILILLGLIAGYLELGSPGLGWPGFICALCFATFFFGTNAAGLAGKEEFLIFGIGIILILLELFVIPGTGIAGVTGVAMVLGSVLFAMVQKYPGIVDDGWMPNFDHMSDIRTPLVTLSTAIIGSGIGIGLAARFLPKSRFFNSRLILQQSTDAASGYTAAPNDQSLVGKMGMTTTALRPAGSAKIGDTPYDVVSTGAFIDSGVDVIVLEVQGSRIVVNEATAEPTPTPTPTGGENA